MLTYTTSIVENTRNRDKNSFKHNSNTIFLSLALGSPMDICVKFSRKVSAKIRFAKHASHKTIVDLSLTNFYGKLSSVFLRIIQSKSLHCPIQQLKCYTHTPNGWPLIKTVSSLFGVDSSKYYQRLQQKANQNVKKSRNYPSCQNDFDDENSYWQDMDKWRNNHQLNVLCVSVTKLTDNNNSNNNDNKNNSSNYSNGWLGSLAPPSLHIKSNARQRQRREACCPVLAHPKKS